MSAQTTWTDVHHEFMVYTQLVLLYGFMCVKCVPKFFEINYLKFFHIFSNENINSALCKDLIHSKKRLCCCDQNFVALVASMKYAEVFL